MIKVELFFCIYKRCIRHFSEYTVSRIDRSDPINKTKVTALTFEELYDQFR